MIVLNVEENGSGYLEIDGTKEYFRYSSLTQQRTELTEEQSDNYEIIDDTLKVLDRTPIITLHFVQVGNYLRVEDDSGKPLLVRKIKLDSFAILQLIDQMVNMAETFIRWFKH